MYMTETRVRHMVLFSLKHAEGSAESQAFLADGYRLLRSIPGVQKLEVLKQISSKSDYDYACSMEFDDQAAYELYSAHPTHISFVNERFLVEVARFQEIDFVSC